MMSPPSWMYHIAATYYRLDAATVTPEKALELARPISAAEAEKLASLLTLKGGERNLRKGFVRKT